MRAAPPSRGRRCARSSCVADTPRSLALAAARAFRLGLEAQGNEALAAFVDALVSSGAVPEELGGAIGEVVEAQGRRDWLAVADGLEHDLAPRL